MLFNHRTTDPEREIRARRLLAGILLAMAAVLYLCYLFAPPMEELQQSAPASAAASSLQSALDGYGENPGSETRAALLHALEHKTNAPSHDTELYTRIAEKLDAASDAELAKHVDTLRTLQQPSPEGGDEASQDLNP